MDYYAWNSTTKVELRGVNLAGSSPCQMCPIHRQITIAGRYGSDTFWKRYNLNPCCFGEIYWVGSVVGSDYVVFAVWIPYSYWVIGPLPILFYFRSAYNDEIYLRTRAAAAEQRATNHPWTPPGTIIC